MSFADRVHNTHVYVTSVVRSSSLCKLRIVNFCRPRLAFVRRSARPRQQIAHRAVVPSPAARRPHAPVIQRRGDGAERGRTRRLYLAHDGQHVGGEGVRCLPVGRYALGLCVGQVGPVSQNGTLRLLLRQRSRVRSAISARSFSARAA